MIGDKKLNLSVLQFDIFELAFMVTSELKMLQEEGARVGFVEIINYTLFFYKKLFYKKVSLIFTKKLRNP